MTRGTRFLRVALCSPLVVPEYKKYSVESEKSAFVETSAVTNVSSPVVSIEADSEAVLVDGVIVTLPITGIPPAVRTLRIAVVNDPSSLVAFARMK